MSTARDLIGRSGAPGPAGQPPAPKPITQAQADGAHKNPGAKGQEHVRGGQVSSGGGKPPTSVRPKV